MPKIKGWLNESNSNGRKLVLADTRSSDLARTLSQSLLELRGVIIVCNYFIGYMLTLIRYLYCACGQEVYDKWNPADSNNNYLLSIYTEIKEDISILQLFYTFKKKFFVWKFLIEWSEFQAQFCKGALLAINSHIEGTWPSDPLDV